MCLVDNNDKPYFISSTNYCCSILCLHHDFRYHCLWQSGRCDVRLWRIDQYHFRITKYRCDSGGKQHPAGKKIKFILGPALESLKKIRGPFDLVFIDADKAGYVDYLNLLLDSQLLAPNALICVDNTLMQGQPYLSGEATVNGAAIAKFNQAVADDPRIEQVLLPLRDGLTLIRRV